MRITPVLALRLVASAALSLGLLACDSGGGGLGGGGSSGDVTGGDTGSVGDTGTPIADTGQQGDTGTVGTDTGGGDDTALPPTDTGTDAACVPDCGGKECGDDGCGGSCGGCDAGDSCDAGVCVPDACIPDCDGKVCGPDGCGATCGDCQGTEICDAGACVPEPVCVPECEGQECGDDGCGSTCGECGANEKCEEGQCVSDACVPDCEDKECGDDGCDGSCGTCGLGESCKAGLCIAPTCVPDCAGKECGPDGCGELCGECPFNHVCSIEQTCVAVVCEPACDGKQCGPNGCGGVCGECAEGESCTAAGACETGECVPSCDGKQCGPDGCGGYCGKCTGTKLCTLSGQCTKQGETLSCSELNLCQVDCGADNQPCIDACYDKATNVGANYLSALSQCADAAGCFNLEDTAAFQSCVAENCGLEIMACFPSGTGSCLQFFGCVNGCGSDAACEAGCFGESAPSAVEAATAVLTCASQAGCYDFETVNDIQACAETFCAPFITQCEENVAEGTCAELFTCTDQCAEGDDACTSACAAATSPEGMNQANDLVMCLDTSGCYESTSLGDFAACASTKCDSAVAPCYGGNLLGCVDIYACFGGCGDNSSCLTTCAQQASSDGINQLMALETCVADKGCLDVPDAELGACAEAQCEAEVTGCGFALSTPGSCAEICDSTEPAPGSAPPCYCDVECLTYGDCCADACDLCGHCG